MPRCSAIQHDDSVHDLWNFKFVLSVIDVCFRTPVSLVRKTMKVCMVVPLTQASKVCTLLQGEQLEWFVPISVGSLNGLPTPSSRSRLYQIGANDKSEVAGRSLDGPMIPWIPRMPQSFGLYYVLPDSASSQVRIPSS